MNILDTEKIIKQIKRQLLQPYLLDMQMAILEDFLIKEV